jgi:multidrug efflux pump subunit AcrA (membrane-fusion protein)
VILRQGEEGAIIAPAAGRVTAVPVTQGSVIMAGEPIAIIASGPLLLRLALPERHAALLVEGALLSVDAPGNMAQGRLVKLYPQIENGRVLADIALEGLDAALLNARLLVRVPVGERTGLFVPEAAIITRSGLDFVRVVQDGAPVERNVVTGERMNGRVEILTGVSAGDTVVTDAAGEQP